MSRWIGVVRASAMGVAVLSPVASHAAVALGQGYGVALGLAGLQAVAAGAWVGSVLPRAAGAAVTAVLLLGLAWGARQSAATGLLLAAGLSHAMLYAGLLAVFAATLRPGRESLITGVARRLNPSFHAGMVPYTRGVTAAWCGFFAAQLVASAVLLAVSPALWRAFVTTVHAPLVLVMAVAEFAVRRWRWRHEHYTGLRATVGGVRRLSRARRSGGVDEAGAAAAGERTSTPA